MKCQCLQLLLCYHLLVLFLVTLYIWLYLFWLYVCISVMFISWFLTPYTVPIPVSYYLLYLQVILCDTSINVPDILLGFHMLIYCFYLFVLTLSIKQKKFRFYLLIHTFTSWLTIGEFNWLILREIINIEEICCQFSKKILDTFIVLHCSLGFPYFWNLHFGNLCM